MIKTRIIIDKICNVIPDETDRVGLKNSSPLLDSLINIPYSFKKSANILVIDFREELYLTIAKYWKTLSWNSDYRMHELGVDKKTLIEIIRQIKIVEEDYDFLVFDLSWENINKAFADFFVDCIKKIVKNNKKIFFVCSGFTKNKPNDHFYYDNFFECYSFKLFKDSAVPDDDIVSKNKKFLSLNRRPRKSRLEFVKSLYQNDLDQYFILSHPAFDEFPAKVLDLDVNTLHFADPTIQDCNDDYIDHALRKENEFCQVNNDLCRQAFFNIITESIVLDEADMGMFITEKTFKSIYAKLPFIIYGQRYILKNLRDLGYQTYSPFIDEQYDLEENELNRRSLIIDEIKRIAHLPEDEFIETYNQCYRIAEYNHHHFIRQNLTGMIGKKFIDFLLN
jgi:hypothetical protein